MSLRTLSAMVTPRADVRALSRLTPRMQIYCVSALAARFKICLGTVMEAQMGVWSRSREFPNLDEMVEFERLGGTKDGW